MLEFDEPVTEEAIRQVFVDQGQANPIVQRLGTGEENTWQVRTAFATTDEVQAIMEALDAEVGTINAASRMWIR